MSQIKVGVTGATGFIGRHVVTALLNAGAAVTAGVRDPAKLCNLSRDLRTVPLDIDQPAQAFEALGRPDVVVHLAWDGLPNYRSLHHFEEELPRQYRFLRGLVTDGLPALLVTGTCMEYGMQSGPLPETTECRPDNPYAFAKHALHRQLTFLKAQKPFNLTWARLFYTYGEGQAPTSLWPQLMAALKRGDNRFDMSGGEQLRDFLPVEVMAGHIARLALARGEVGAVNVCAGRPISVRALVERWIAESGKSIDLNLGRYPYPDWEPMAFWGCARKLDRVTKEVRGALSFAGEK